MGAIRIMQWIAYVAGLGALGVGQGIVQIDLSMAYLVIGCAVIFSLQPGDHRAGTRLDHVLHRVPAKPFAG